MLKRLSILLVCLILQAGTAHAGVAVYDWKTWDNYPNAPRMTANQVQQLMLDGEKMVFIYAGYKTRDIICGSIYLPYTWVPPNSSGAMVNLEVPKDTWMVAYCP